MNDTKKTLEELLEKYLNDERYPDADPAEMRAQVTRLFNKYQRTTETVRLRNIEWVVEARFGEPPPRDFEPMDLNIKNILKEKGIL